MGASATSPGDASHAAWSALAQVAARGYEIHHGRTEALSAAAVPVLHDEQGRCLGWRQGQIMGVYLHGLFESDAVLRALLGADAPSLDRVMDGLADFIDQHFDAGTLMRLLQAPASS
jgi:adenosylcobyric acid synthase